MYAARSPRFHAPTCASRTAVIAARSAGSKRRGAGARGAARGPRGERGGRGGRAAGGGRDARGGEGAEEPAHAALYRARRMVAGGRAYRTRPMGATFVIRGGVVHARGMRLGIDFGTTRTVVAAVRDGRHPLVAFDEGELREHVPGIAAQRGAASSCSAGRRRARSPMGRRSTRSDRSSGWSATLDARRRGAPGRERARSGHGLPRRAPACAGAETRTWAGCGRRSR